MLLNMGMYVGNRKKYKLSHPKYNVREHNHENLSCKLNLHIFNPSL